jgi:1-acyl-sn-glycerol-3-phosphate acyltransferase
MGNHQSIFDIMLVLGYIDKPLAFIAKKELAKYPLVSHWMRYIGSIFLDRSDARQAVRVFQEAVDRVKRGWSMVIFPEGTRSRSMTMAAFKKGSMKLPMRAGAAIVPVSINGTYKIFEGNGMRIGSAAITMVIAEPILPGNFADLESGELSEMVRKRIEQGLL